MIVEVVAVGDELLTGRQVNTNAARIGEALAGEGFVLTSAQVVADDVEAIAGAIRLAASRSDAVLVTGGLGPTPDDLTREGLAAATGRPLVVSDEVAEGLRLRFAAAGLDMPESNLRQAEHPAGARLLPNPRGTAPGIVVDEGATVIIALPGVPPEMEGLLASEVLPLLISRRSGGEAVRSHTLRTWGESESRVAELLAGLGGPATNPAVGFYAAAGEIRVLFRAGAGDGESAERLLAPVVAEAATRLGELVYGFDDETVESVVLHLAGARGWTVGTAESVTGGLVASRLTSVPGASKSFRGAIVSYAVDVKRGLLGVGEEALAAGVISGETAAAMASGARALLGVDVAVAVTGSAGPTPGDRPVGTVVVAAETPGSRIVRTFRFGGDREDVRAFATTAALHVCRQAILAA